MFRGSLEISKVPAGTNKAGVIKLSEKIGGAGKNWRASMEEPTVFRSRNRLYETSISMPTAKRA